MAYFDSVITNQRSREVKRRHAGALIGGYMFATQKQLACLLALLASQIALDARGVPADAAHSERTVHIYRDHYGMAHLYAAREEDGFYGLGYATGEDRLRQVLTWYLAVRGELAARFGPTTPPPYPHNPSLPGSSEPSPLTDAIASDIAARKFHILDTARRNFSQLPLQYQTDMRSYVAGLREYMRTHPQDTPEWAPPLEPALPVAVFHLFALEERAVCSTRKAADAAVATRTAARISAARDDALPFGASNAWAVAGSRTVDGRVILGSDSHGVIEVYGTLFYPYRIKAGTFDFMAFDPAGTAMFLFGHSPYFGWGVTEGPRFVADCYRVQTDPKDPHRYMFDGRPQKMTTEPYEIKVKGAATLRGTFEYTHHNGVRSAVDSRDGTVAYVVSYASADRIGLEDGEYYQMAKARTRGELEAALEQRNIYPANLVIGGADGTIMYIRPGRIPIRAPGIDARRTLDGNTSATAWRGIYSYAQALKLINPPEGYISNSNVSPDSMYPNSPLQPASYPPEFAFEPGQTNTRQQRLIELLSQASKLSVAGAQAIAMDETITAARLWAPVFEGLLRTREDLFAAQPSELRTFVEELARFDGVFSKQSRAALYHEAVRRDLLEKHPEQLDALVGAIESGAKLSAEQEQLLIQAAAEARSNVLAAHGRVDLSYGDVHRVGRGGVNLPVGGAVVPGIPLRTHVVEQQPAPAPATQVTRVASIRALGFVIDPATKTEWMTGGERVPFVVHFATTGAQSYAQTLWGVSDVPSSPHYSDQADLASRRQLRRIPLSITELEQEHATETVLVIGKH